MSGYLSGRTSLTSVATENLEDNAVTTAKIADVNVTTGKVVDDAVTLAKMAPGTDGNLITYDASGNPAAVATGSSTNVLTSNGAGAAPTFQAAGVVGKILQVVNVSSDTTGSFSSSSTDTYAAITDAAVSITPSATSSRILVHVHCVIAASVAGTKHVSLFRDTTKLGAANVSNRVGGTTALLHANAHYALEQWPVDFHYVDSPSSTSAISYNLKATLGSSYSGTIYWNRTQNDTDASYGARDRIQMTAIEISGA
jgi:hypothetical protein